MREMMTKDSFMVKHCAEVKKTHPSQNQHGKMNAKKKILTVAVIENGLCYQHLSLLNNFVHIKSLYNALFFVVITLLSISCSFTITLSLTI